MKKLLLACFLAAGCRSAGAPPALAGIGTAGIDQEPPTMVYFVRHAEVDPGQPTIPLNPVGLRKADAFARAVSEIAFTHVFSSHTTRSRQMVEPAARARNLSVRQLPHPGIQRNGTIVTDTTSSRVAIEPLVRALSDLPQGSRALVGVNSDNVYSILNGLGVPVGTAERPCASGQTCVPCLSKACALPRTDQMWMLIRRNDAASPVLVELRWDDVPPASTLSQVPSSDSLAAWIRRGYSLTARDGKTPDVSPAVREVWGELGWSGIGYGFRTLSARKPAPDASMDQGIASFASTMDYFSIRLDDLQASVVGDIGLVWGVHTEEFRMKGREPETVRVRFTNTLRWDGRSWKNLLYHRDAQVFDDRGWYVRK
jgi:hypothetical protein